MRVMNNLKMAVAAVALLLMASCGSTKKMEGTGKVNAQNKKTETKAADAAEVASMKNLAFVQKVAGNQVYAKNIVGNMTFNLQAAGKDITVPGKLSMRKDEVIRIQLFIPILGSEVGRLEFTPNYAGGFPAEAGHQLLFAPGTLLEPVARARREEGIRFRPEEILGKSR